MIRVRRDRGRQREIAEPASTVGTTSAPGVAPTAGEAEPWGVRLSIIVAAGLGGLIYYVDHVHHSFWGFASAAVFAAWVPDAAWRAKRRYRRRRAAGMRGPERGN
jgi:hypothetical protein